MISISAVSLGAGGRTRTGTLSPAVDFESTTSANSITPARRLLILTHCIIQIKRNFHVNQSLTLVDISLKKSLLNREPGSQTGVWPVF